jgi:hypothetical protein
MLPAKIVVQALPVLRNITKRYEKPCFAAAATMIYIQQVFDEFAFLNDGINSNGEVS